MKILPCPTNDLILVIEPVMDADRRCISYLGGHHAKGPSS